MPKRTEMWNWMVECLQLKSGEKGPYSYVATQVKRYDVMGLYYSIIRVANIQTPFAYQKKMEDFINAVPEQGENFFSFAERGDARRSD